MTRSPLIAGTYEVLRNNRWLDNVLGARTAADVFG